MSPASRFNFKTLPLLWSPTTVSVTTFPTDLTPESIQYGATEPVSAPPTATADAGHVSPGPTDTDTFSFLMFASSNLDDFDGGIKTVLCNNRAG